MSFNNHHKKIFIPGVNGLVGQKVVAAAGTEFELLGLDLQPEYLGNSNPGLRYESLDFTNYNKLKDIIESFRPDYIVNTAAFTNVDGCEGDKEHSWQVNVVAPRYLAELSRRYDAHFTHISSDYVFNGDSGPYKESDTPEPISAYGRQKLASENEVLATGCRHTILRGIVIYGWNGGASHNFATWLVRELSEKKKVRIVTDQWGNTLLADDMAKAIMAGIKRDATGLYHVGNNHFHSRYDFAKHVAEVFGLDQDLIEPILTAELNQAAKRPLRSGLMIDKISSEFGFRPMEFVEGLEMLKGQMKNG